MTTYLGKSCSFCLPRVPFVNCRQFMYLVVSLLVLRAGYGIWLCRFLIIACLFALSVGHSSSNYHQHSKCTVLFVKHHYFHLSLFKKLLSSCWLIQVYIQCKTISSCRHFRHQQNRNWNSVHHCIKTWQKMQKLIICNSALFCNVSKTYSSYINSK